VVVVNAGASGVTRTRGIRQKKRHLDLPRGVAAPVFHQHGELFFIVFFNRKRLLAIAAEEEIKKPLVLKGTGFLNAGILAALSSPRASTPSPDFSCSAGRSGKRARRADDPKTSGGPFLRQMKAKQSMFIDILRRSIAQPTDQPPDFCSFGRRKRE
jgi:hypothetical protein